MDGESQIDLESAYLAGYNNGGEYENGWFKEELRASNQPESLFTREYAQEIEIPTKFSSDSRARMCFQYGVYDRVMGRSESPAKRSRELSGAR